MDSSNKPDNGNQSESALIRLVARTIAAPVRVGRAIKDRIRRLFGKKRGRYAPLVDVPTAAAALSPRVMKAKAPPTPANAPGAELQAPNPSFIAIPVEAEDEVATEGTHETELLKPLPFKKSADFQATESAADVDHDMIARVQARKTSSAATRWARANAWLGQRKIARLHRRFPLWQVATFYLIIAGMLSLYVSMHVLGKPNRVTTTHAHPNGPAKDQDPRVLLADIAQLISLKHYDEAEKELATLRTLWPNDARIYQVEGALLAGRKDYKGARQAFEKALELQPQARSVLFNLAEVDFVAGDYAAAAAGYKKLPELWSKNGMILFRLYLCERMQKHDREAAELEANPNLKPESVEWLYVQAAKNIMDKNERVGFQYVDKARLIYPEEGKVCELTLQRLGLIK
ncbi:hypothetical protein BH09VER1_BH09VER1_25790 [soil metagenome]